MNCCKKSLKTSFGNFKKWEEFLKEHCIHEDTSNGNVGESPMEING